MFNQSKYGVDNLFNLCTENIIYFRSINKSSKPIVRVQIRCTFITVRNLGNADLNISICRGNCFLDAFSKCESILLANTIHQWFIVPCLLSTVAQVTGVQEPSGAQTYCRAHLKLDPFSNHIHFTF